MTHDDVRRTFLEFFTERGHERIPGSTLIPPDPDDPVLLVSSGMHPLTPSLSGRPHPQGRRLVNGNAACARPTSTRSATTRTCRSSRCSAPGRWATTTGRSRCAGATSC